MSKYTHSIWRYIPAFNNKPSTFKFVENIVTDNDAVPDLHDYYCIDSVLNKETGQIRIKNHSAPDYCISKFTGWTLELPPVEKTNKQDIYVVYHRSSFSHKKIEYDEFLEPKDKRYTEEEWLQVLKWIEQKFNKQKEWAKDGIKTPASYEDGSPVFKTENEFKAFSMGRRAYFLYHLVNDYKFIHLIRKLNVGYTE